MKYKIDFTVIILTKKRDFFLKYALNSLINQNYQPQEIIIIDNEGSFKTKNLISSILKNKISYIYKPITKTNNVAILRNIAAKKAKSSYLAFLDDDDFWHKKYLFYSKKIINFKKTDLLISNISKFENKNSYHFSNFKKGKKFEINDFLLVNPGTLYSNIIVRKKTFLELYGFDKNISGSCDKDLVLRFLKQKKKININHNYHVFYRFHNNQWSINSRKVIFQKILFYKKYFNLYSFIYHLKFMKVILNIAFNSIFKKKHNTL